MKSAFFCALLLVGFSIQAQTPEPVTTAAPVGIDKESHHHLVLENSYVKAWRVSVPAGDSTILHLHNVPYIWVSLGAADFANDVTGKPEARVKTVDGQVAYSRGSFAHVVRMDANLPFNNVTVELLRPQGEPRNLCDQVVPGDIGSCDVNDSGESAAVAVRPMFETDEIRVSLVTLRKQGGLMQKPLTQAALLVAASGPPIKVEQVSDVATRTLQAGETIWLPPDAQPKFTVERGAETRLLLISFKDSAAAAIH